VRDPVNEDIASNRLRPYSIGEPPGGYAGIEDDETG
jgi:hypothetical protein